MGEPPLTHTQDKRTGGFRLEFRDIMSRSGMGYRRRRRAAPWEQETSDGAACTPRVGGAGSGLQGRPDAAARIPPPSAPEGPWPSPRGRLPRHSERRSSRNEDGVLSSRATLISTSAAGHSNNYPLPSPEQEEADGAPPRRLPQPSCRDGHRTRETPERRENPPTLPSTGCAAPCSPHLPSHARHRSSGPGNQHHGRAQLYIPEAHWDRDVLHCHGLCLCFVGGMGHFLNRRCAVLNRAVWPL